MRKLTHLTGLLCVVLILSACESGIRTLHGESRAGPSTHIEITAEAGSEVVVSKYVGTVDPPTDTHSALPSADFDLTAVPALSFPADVGDTGPVILEADATVLADTPILVPAPPSPAPGREVVSAVVEPPPVPALLGDIRVEPWAVHPGETLLDAIQRFARRAGYSVQKAVGDTTWEITSAASFEGDFEGALAWLMMGFAHTRPQPILTLHPNQVVRLSVE